MQNLHVTYFPMEQKYSVWTEDHKLVKEWFNTREEADSYIGKLQRKSFKYSVELMWNREFDFSHYRKTFDLESALKLAESLSNMGDGTSVKRIRIIDLTTGKVL